ncbi:nickel pincer cofactor biosynthesis protein LarC [Streptomyces galbus]|uniref:Pyridinium-3,5-bisthiocarboxylic acid mononucleotide nickel insertion protein n=1 Tax=Streptomyces galbus TaxID=33898 RepID=A0A4U5WZF0_STRGB|nr:nickel pincer cofactor biosynthesis protein LarC [Streptomyces galbus]TKT08027.1 nickel pincer cofactor biosynthesis protein LarC [Streptomyces galbus]GHD42309.1 UPF0272 protein [Streptomyces galbus]
MICWVNPFTGLAGDMFLAALIDAGASIEAVRAAISSTGLTGWHLEAHTVVDHGLKGTRLQIQVTDSVASRRAGELITMARRARTPVADIAVAALAAVARVEAHLHNTEPDQVHLHELGGHDTLVDVVGCAAALHDLGVTRTVCAPLPLGRGTVHCAHGTFPSPAPATLALLQNAEVIGSDLDVETVTPTGAALLVGARSTFGRMPAMRVTSTGYGMGTRSFPDRPNTTVATIGRETRTADLTTELTADHRETVATLSTNLDDVTAETLAYTLERALEGGALDAWCTPVTMKKGRPAHVLHVLARPEDAAALIDLVAAETGTLGVRIAVGQRAVLARSTQTVQVRGHTIRIKHGPHGSKPEHEDLARAARDLSLPLRDVASRARALVRQPAQSKEASADEHDR